MGGCVMVLMVMSIDAILCSVSIRGLAQAVKETVKFARPA